MPLPEASDNWLSALGVVGSGVVIGIGLWFRSYLSGRSEEGDLHGKHVILEQAELANLGNLQNQLNTLAPKIEAVIAQDEARRALISRLGDNFSRDMERMSDQLGEAMKILRRLDGELDVARRLREEKILRRDD